MEITPSRAAQQHPITSRTNKLNPHLLPHGEGQANQYSFCLALHTKYLTNPSHLYPRHFGFLLSLFFSFSFITTPSPQFSHCMLSQILYAVQRIICIWASWFVTRLPHLVNQASLCILCNAQPRQARFMYVLCSTYATCALLCRGLSPVRQLCIPVPSRGATRFRLINNTQSPARSRRQNQF
jgi:hypothetical protein